MGNSVVKENIGNIMVMEKKRIFEIGIRMVKKNT